ncbi:helix-turn-helix domain-containing protein [Salinilacihabitans rarus]|uniref:helix-turn-helix domain-containing protein n=1 Tax=Salinilacihabitans rarus TaxID=2961596 RepID=UPI0020C8BCE3|nr:helix-turn-helix domain-containing protein [Salinilacihabitans rarus]
MSVQTSRSGQLEESEVFHILGNDRRRAIVQILAERRNHVGVSDVATEIASQESDSTPVPNNLYKSVYVSLQQTHLPQLEEDDVIEYDPEGKTISPGPHFDDVLTYVDGDHGDGAAVLRLHLGLCVFGLALIALTGLDLPVVSALDPVLASVFVFLVVAASSLYSLLG